MCKKNLMVRFLMLILSMVLVLSAVSCGDDVPSNANNDSKVEISDSVSDNEIKSDIESVASDEISESVVEDEEFVITDIRGEYSEGYAFVEINHEEQTTYCIDKNGNVKFKLDDKYWAVSGFKNGYALLKKYSIVDDSTCLLCDETGKIITPEEVGATSFYYDENFGYPVTEMFADGYITVVRTTTSYKGSKTEYGIMNTDFKMVLDYCDGWIEGQNDSMELFSNFDEYRNGMLYQKNGDRIWFIDFRDPNPLVSEDWNKFFEKAAFSRPSDFWIGYDQVWDYTGKLVLDLYVHGDSVRLLDDFENGVAPIMFEPGGEEAYFCIVDDENNLKFEPVFIGKDDGWNTSVEYHGCDNGKYLVFFNDNHTHKLYLFDETGLIKQHELTGDVYSFSDEMIIIRSNDYYDRTYTVLTTDFEPAF